MQVLVLNCGSSSLKYKLIDLPDAKVLSAGRIQRIAAGGFPLAISEVLEAVSDHKVDAVGHRVVHGGARFTDATRIDNDVIKGIEDCIPLAPLHNPANLEGIRAAKTAMPRIPHVAVFDTAFHARLPRRARTYAIDTELAEEHGIRRYGFHGTSHAFVSREAARWLKMPRTDLRIVTCHLGNGSSLAAVEFGVSVETSMGMTPLEGLMMGTRCGDIDAGALLYLLERGVMDVETLSHKLQKESGLLGVSGISNDLRDIEERAADGDDRARLAITVYAHRVRKYIGAYAATMGGVDVIVMTGGIGENSATLRKRILQRFEFLGLIIDLDANLSVAVESGGDTFPIHASNSRVKALVVGTDEERMIAEETSRIAGGEARIKKKDPLPIAVSARHVHLDTATFAQLFGEGAELSSYKELSQPGQFAANEKVNIIGPRGRLDGVRILGPLRPACQVEVSRTDEFELGVDAPVRHSGDVTGSAPITLEGPQGSVHLAEGLICAWRHIHLTPEDAAAYGVKDRDEVQVEITGGVRDLTFSDVVVRVSERYATEMHIDTDEANAAELPSRSEGELVGVEGVGAVIHRRRETE